MTSEEINRIAIQWFDAFNHHDLELLLALYDEDAEHYSPKLKVRLPETKGLLKGKVPCGTGGRILLTDYLLCTIKLFSLLRMITGSLWNTSGK
jgi:hypothetical protein